MVLRYKPFRSCQRIVNVVISGKWLYLGEKSDGVMLLQGGLVSLGATMPITMRSGSPDGSYGNETVNCVKDFQGANGCTIDGIAGTQTLTKMDKLLAQKLGLGLPPAAPGVPAPPMVPVFRDKNYILGTNDPVLRHDLGAGAWDSKSREVTYIALAAAIIRILPPFPESLVTRLVTGPNAMRHMDHFFGNSGHDLTIKMESMIVATERNKKRLASEVHQAKTFCETLPLGQHNITSRNVNIGNNDKHETKDWFFATGGYQSWGKGKVKITEDASGVRQYALNFEYKMFDRYNWDGGKSVDIAGITVTDEFMAEFHRQGIAREFNQYGSVKRQLSWSHGALVPHDNIYPPDGRGS